MLTYSDMQAELLSRLQAANNSTLWTTARLETLIQDAYRWATGLFNWPQTQSAKVSSTVKDQEAYDYPGDFRSNSVVRVVIDSKRYDRKAFEDYLDFKLENPDQTQKRIFADFNRQIFILPVPTANGNGNLSVWGHNEVAQLSGGTDTTIFSTSDEPCNEAIVKKALSVAIKKINPNLAITESNEAQQILANAFSVIKSNQQRDQRLDHPRFQVPNFFGPGHSSRPGNFSIVN
jgi:hypothetical protein